MNESSNIFLNKKILIYGLGKSGISSFIFLKKRNKVFLFDDNTKIILNKKYKKIWFHLVKLRNLNLIQ